MAGGNEPSARAVMALSAFQMAGSTSAGSLPSGRRWFMRDYPTRRWLPNPLVPSHTTSKVAPMAVDPFGVLLKVSWLMHEGIELDRRHAPPPIGRHQARMKVDAAVAAPGPRSSTLPTAARQKEDVKRCRRTQAHWARHWHRTRAGSKKLSKDSFKRRLCLIPAITPVRHRSPCRCALSASSAA
jgi:hypothetical protein